MTRLLMEGPTAQIQNPVEPSEASTRRSGRHAGPSPSYADQAPIWAEVGFLPRLYGWSRIVAAVELE